MCPQPKMVGTHRRGVRSVWSCAAVIVPCRAAILAAGLLRPGRSRAGVDWRAAILAAVPSRWVERGRGFFRPGWSPAVAALVRARKTRFKSRSRVCVTKPPTPARNGSARLYQLPTPRVSGVISVTRKPTCPWWVVPGAGTSFSVTAR